MASILVIGPHPDDQELGMGGTVLTLAAQGHKVHLVDMTNGEPTPHGSPETPAPESAAAARGLGGARTAGGRAPRPGGGGGREGAGRRADAGRAAQPAGPAHDRGALQAGGRDPQAPGRLA